MRKILSVILLFIISHSINAENLNQKSEPRHAVGLSLGWVVANGLSYRRYFGSQFIQGTFAGAVDKDVDKEYVDVSISYGNYLNHFDLADGRFPVGFKFIAGIEAERDTDRQDDLVSTAKNKGANEIHTGAGFGLDFINPNRRGIVISLDLIYTASFRGINKREFVRLGMLPSASIQYNM